MLPEGGTTLGGPAGNAPSGVRREGVASLPALTVLCHPDLSRIGDRAFLGELARGRTALLSRQQPRFAAPGAAPGAVGEPLADPFLSRQPLGIEPLAGGGVRIRAGSPTRLAVDGLLVEESHVIPGRRPSDVTDGELLAALREHRWNLRATAEALGVACTSLYSLLDRSPRVRSASDVPSEEIRLCHACCGGDLPAMVAELEVSERGLRQRLKDLGLR